ncbi:MAG: hypothetical protein ACK4NN_05220 [Rheinheimera sp.]
MKLVLKMVLGIALILLGWVLWPEADTSVAVQGNTVELAANPAKAATISPVATPTATSDNTVVESPTELCLSADQLGSAFQKLQQQRVHLTHQLIDLHIQLGIKKPQTLQVLQAVGGDLEVFQFRQSAEKRNFAKFKQKNPWTVIDQEPFMRLHSAISQQDYDQLLQLIQQFPLADRPGLFTQSQLSVLGHVIIGNPQIPFSIIQQLIDVGIQPFFSDLAAFTALDLPLPLIDMVQQHFKGELQQQWQDNFRTYNLTLLAAENASVELFDYWRALGIPASLHPQATNAFDLMPLPTSEEQLEQQISKVRTLLAAGILPRSADVRSQWLLLLPEAESTQLSELLQQQPALPVVKDGPDATPLKALEQVQTEFNLLLQQVAACPKAQQWPVGIATVRELPERMYLRSLKMQQEASQRMHHLSATELDTTKQMTAMLQKKDWQGLQDLMRQQPEISREDVEVTVLMFMLMFQASDEDLQQYLNNFKQFSSKQAQQLSEVASPTHRELFKAAGFELPFNAEAAKRHQQLQQLQQQMNKSERPGAKIPQQ